jgi:uncharacterized membrane protein YgdD (TMEM256/DUF423 family)
MNNKQSTSSHFFIDRALWVGPIFLFLSVALGAFGAHGLKGILDQQAMNTFTTGIHYQQLHGVILVIIAIFHLSFHGHFRSRTQSQSQTQTQTQTQTHNLKDFSFSEKLVNKSFIFMTLGTLLFSGNCVVYALSGVKFFAHLVPLGGVSLLVGHYFLVRVFFNLKNILD